MAKLTGADKALRRLRKLNSPAAERRVGAALMTAANALAVDAAISIEEGSAGGSSGGKHQHVPSKPGEPPNSSTGYLASSIEAAKVAPLEMEVSANAPYASHLEFGTSKMSARPFMKPAVERIRPEAEKFVAEALRREIRKG